MITEELKTEFKRLGFLVLQSGIEEELIERARTEALERVDEDPADYDSLVEAEQFQSVSLASTGVFEEINERLHEYMEELVGEGTLAPPDNPDLELNYPEGTDPWDTDARQVTDLNCQLEGYGDQFRRGDEVEYVTAYASVYLDDHPVQGGALTMWPGSHWRAGEFFEDFPLHDGYMGVPAVDPTRTDDDWEHIQQGSTDWDFERRWSDEFDGFEVGGDAGTVVLAHGKTAFAPGVNNSRKLRTSLRQRFVHEKGDDIKEDAAANIWKYWPAMQDVDAKVE